jgi:copper oxidase (laccase) domain-containing protein
MWPNVLNCIYSLQAHGITIMNVTDLKGVFSLGFGSYCLRTDGLITVISLLVWAAIARELMV